MDQLDDVEEPTGRGAEEFRAFYEMALPTVYGYFFHRVAGRREVAEELTQETFMALVVAVGSGVHIEGWKGWTMAVARNKLVDHYRREARRSRLRGGNSPAWSGPSHESGIELADLLAELPPAQRAVLVLRYIEDLPVREIAKALGRSVRSTESLLVRGRRRLEELWTADGG